MTEPKYDEDTVNLGYLKKVISDTEENIEDTYKNVSRHYATKPNTPYYKGDTWIDGNIVYTCINSREIGLYTDSDWTTESGAKQEAERKNKTYLTQPSNYSAGDMWILQSDNDHKAGKKGEILISSAGRKEYNADDWTNMLGYGTIKSINEVSNNLNNAINRIGNVEEAIEDGIIITFYQNTVPEAKHVGDLWYVTGELEGYIKGKIYRYDGTNWVILNDPAIQEAFDEANEARLVADGKIQSFYSDTEPTENMGVGDLWIDLANNNQLYRYNGTNWVAVYDTRINDLVTSVDSVTERVTTIETDLGEIDLKVQENTTTITTIEGNVNNITNTQGEAEGKNIHLTDSAEEPFVDISLHGESTQEGTPTPDNPIEIENIEGINIWDEEWELGGLNSLGVTTNETDRIRSKNYIPVLPNTKYYYKVPNTIGVRYYDINKTFISSVNATNVFQTTPSNCYYIKFMILNTTEYNNNIIIAKNKVPTKYVPYNSLEFKVEGKNLFDKTKFKEINRATYTYSNGIYAITPLGTGNVSLDIYINLPAGIYTYSGNGSNATQVKNSSGAIIANNVSSSNTTFTITEEGTYIRFNWGTGTSTDAFTLDTNNIQIESGSTATDYEPYKSQVVYIPLTEGQKLMEGSYLADDGIHHSRGQVVFDGSDDENWQIEGANNFYSNIVIQNSKSSSLVLCNYQKSTYRGLGESENCFISSSKKFNFQSDTINHTVADFKNWLSTHNLIVEYELAEPEVVPFTAEQQEAWNNIRALMTYKNVTNISSDAYAKIVYMRDNGLDVYETKQNASKNYTETTKKLAEQKITVDGIVSEVSETKSNINTINNNLIELNETVSTTEQRVNEYEIKFEEKTKTINEELKENSETIKSMSYTFNTDDLSIAKSDDPVNAKINNSGMRVYSYNELKAIFNDKGTGIQKLIVVGSAQIGNLQIVKATDENGEACTDFHHLVSNIQNLEDLEVG